MRIFSQINDKKRQMSSITRLYLFLLILHTLKSFRIIFLFFTYAACTYVSKAHNRPTVPKVNLQFTNISANQSKVKYSSFSWNSFLDQFVVGCIAYFRVIMCGVNKKLLFSGFNSNFNLFRYINTLKSKRSSIFSQKLLFRNLMCK